MSFRDIIAEVQNLTEDEKRQLLELRERDLCNYAEEENPEFLAMLEIRIRAANQGGRTYSLPQAREALKKFVKQLGQ
jgi:excinuclease UvrABC nuclease subunit